jgi:hypothetical protein
LRTDVANKLRTAVAALAMACTIQVQAHVCIIVQPEGSALSEFFGIAIYPVALELFGLERDSEVLQHSVLDVHLAGLVGEAPDALEEPDLRDRADLMRHRDTLDTRSERLSGKEHLELVDPAPLALALGQRDDRHHVEMRIEAVIREHDGGAALSTLFTSDPRLEIDPVDLPAMHRADVRHPSASSLEPVARRGLEVLADALLLRSENRIARGGGIGIVDTAAAELTELTDQRPFHECVLALSGALSNGLLHRFCDRGTHLPPRLTGWILCSATVRGERGATIRHDNPTLLRLVKMVPRRLPCNGTIITARAYPTVAYRCIEELRAAVTVTFRTRCSFKRTLLCTQATQTHIVPAGGASVTVFELQAVLLVSDTATDPEPGTYLVGMSLFPELATPLQVSP